MFSLLLIQMNCSVVLVSFLQGHDVPLFSPPSPALALGFSEWVSHSFPGGLIAKCTLLQGLGLVLAYCSNPTAKSYMEMPFNLQPPVRLGPLHSHNPPPPLSPPRTPSVNY